MKTVSAISEGILFMFRIGMICFNWLPKVLIHPMPIPSILPIGLLNPVNGRILIIGLKVKFYNCQDGPLKSNHLLVITAYWRVAIYGLAIIGGMLIFPVSLTFVIFHLIPRFVNKYLENVQLFKFNIFYFRPVHWSSR